MTPDPDLHQARREAVLYLLRTRKVASQEEIVELLAERGVEATQSSVSRDLRDLGVVKVGGRYVPPGQPRRAGRGPATRSPASSRRVRAGRTAPHRRPHRDRRRADGGPRPRPRRLAGGGGHDRRRRHHLRRHRRRRATRRGCSHRLERCCCAGQRRDPVLAEAHAMTEPAASAPSSSPSRAGSTPPTACPGSAETLRPAGGDRDRRHRRPRRRGRRRPRPRAPRALGAVRPPAGSTRGRRTSTACCAILIFGNVRRGGLYPLCVGRRARDPGAGGGAGGARAGHRRRWRTAAPRRATTRCASRWRCARSRPSSRSWRRCATSPGRAPSRWRYLEARGLPVPPRGARLLDQPRPLGRDDRRPRDARQRRSRCPRRPGCCPAARFDAAAAAGAPHARLRAGVPGRLGRRGAVAGRARSSGSRPRRRRYAHRPRHPPRATRSSAPRAGWPSRRRPPRCCSPPTASSRSWC